MSNAVSTSLTSDVAMDKLHDAPLPRRVGGRKRRVNRGAVVVLTLLVFATWWKLRASDTDRLSADGEPTTLELHKMQLEGGERYRAYLHANPGYDEGLHHLDEPETEHHSEGEGIGGLVHGKRKHEGEANHHDSIDNTQHTQSKNVKGGDLIADVDDPVDVPGVTQSTAAIPEPTPEPIDQSLYDFDLLPPPKLDRRVKNYQEVDVTKNEHPKWMRDMWSEKTAAVSVTGGELEEKINSIPPELSHVKPGQELFVTFATGSVKDFVVNWLRSAADLNLSPLFVGALDDDMFQYCKENNIPSMLLKGNSVLQNRKKSFITAGDASFKKMGTVKTKFVQDLLEMGIAPILTDADVTWLRDPRSYFKKGTYAIADALVSTDCIDIPGDKRDENGCSHVNFNTGVLHFRPSEASKVFVEQWKTKVATSTIAWMRDQPAFNLLTHEGVGGHSLQPAVRVKQDRKGSEGHRMVYYAANATLKLGVLPNWLFGSGHTYFVQKHHKTHPEDGAPFSVHLTYQYGDTGAYAFGKRERMRQDGLWKADSSEYFGGDRIADAAITGDKEHSKSNNPSTEKFLVVLDSGAQLSFPEPYEIGTDGDAYKSAILRHLSEDKLRRTTVRNGLALAQALGRTLILPKARCYCDKIWNNLNACRAPGSETFTIPYECPMDHIYDLPAWFNGDASGTAVRPFRAAGFLTDDRLSDKLKARESTVRVVVDRSSYETGAVNNGNEKSLAGYPKDSTNGERAWSDDELESAVKMNAGFTANELIGVLKATLFNDEQSIAFDAPILEFDFLGADDTFCGFGANSKNQNSKFDSSTQHALLGDQYYCFTEAWRDMGSPMSGGGMEPYEPQVVKRHCGHMENDFRQMGKVHPGVVEHINKLKPECSCEWGFGQPRPLAEIANDPNLCPKTARG